MYFELKSNLIIIQLAKKVKLNHYSFDGIWVHWKRKMMPRIILTKKEKMKMNWNKNDWNKNWNDLFMPTAVWQNRPYNENAEKWEK